MQALWTDLRYITDNYNGARPLSDFLKAYFKLHHRLGSRDRRILTEGAFAWMRASRGFVPHLDFKTRMQACIALCSTDPRLAKILPSEWHTTLEMPLAKRLDFLKSAEFPFQLSGLWQAPEILSDGISPVEWLDSMLRQPRLFARLRKDAAPLLQRLKRAEIPFEQIGERCIALPIGTALQAIWKPQEYTIQDASSQATGEFLGAKSGESWWDCCAGGGGKTLMLQDSTPGLHITATDVRQSALIALRDRFDESSVTPPRTIVADASDAVSIDAVLGGKTFDGVICDVPCSGSGTWARTPEGLHFFDGEGLESLTEKQARILHNACRRTKRGGRIIYITCSVFRRENEGAIERVTGNSEDIELTSMQLINGIAIGADSLFVAVLEKV